MFVNRKCHHFSIIFFIDSSVDSQFVPNTVIVGIKAGMDESCVFVILFNHFCLLLFLPH